MRLRYTLPALADLASILDFVADRSPQGAGRIHMRIHAVTDLLLRYPLAGALTDDPAVRRITTTPYPYLIFYEANRRRNHHSRGAPRCARPFRQYAIGVSSRRIFVWVGPALAPAARNWTLHHSGFGSPKSPLKKLPATSLSLQHTAKRCAITIRQFRRLLTDGIGPLLISFGCAPFAKATHFISSSSLRASPNSA
ncbi:type II toxin-antitoxin system RelE/ParE family toxin [Bradyrhizobium sediminis]|uniref:type II toxin-antitoxin system RelE/ParE family toxin n=1 Tax=Bradyrhizobium sediminis TaxID=2840469 RepID=UPI00352D1634